MAVYRCEVRRFSRSEGRSVVAAAAYRSAGRLRDERSEKVHDYRRRAPGVAYRETMAPPHAPEWAFDRSRLWNEAERAENRRNSTTAREAIISLPHELDDGQRIELVRDFAQRLIGRYGVAVDLAIHKPDRKGDQRNHHAHVMFTTRRMRRDGLEEKTRELDDRVTGPKEIEAIREMWERSQNRALEQAGHAERVSRLSNREQGIEREPQPKLGEAFMAMDRAGRQPRALDSWQEVARRHDVTKDENRSPQKRRHRLARESVARKYQRESEHSRMRQNMAQQAEQRRRERDGRMEKARAPGGVIEAAMKAARTKEFIDPASRDVAALRDVANHLMRDSSEAVQGRNDAQQAAKDDARKLDEQRAREAEIAAARAWERQRQIELRKKRQAQELQNQNNQDIGRVRKPPAAE